MPCGGCRQAVAEVALLSGRDIPVTCMGGEGEARRHTTMFQLLPQAFGLSR